MGRTSNMYDRLVAGEDLRTEALANLLERVLAGDQEPHTRRFGEFVSRVLLADVTDDQERKEFVRWMNDSATNLSVVTQYRIDDGTVPDMVLFNCGDPVCVVEVKIDAPIGENQLEGYGRWLAAKANNRYRPALVLLTHVTAPPPGFTDGRNGSYSVDLRSVASWNTVAEWFAELCAEEDGVVEPLKSLAGEFGEYLKEEAMPTLDDAAIARQYLAHSQGRLIEAVENMQVSYDFPEHWSPGGRPVSKAVGIWKYHCPEQDHGTRYVYFGLCFKPADENDETLYGYTRYENNSIEHPKPVVIGDGFYAFVCIYGPAVDFERVPGFDKNRWYERKDGKLVESRDGVSADSTGWWHHSGGLGGWGGYARIYSLQELLDGDGRLGNGLKNWSHRAFEKTVSLWNAVFG